MAAAASISRTRTAIFWRSSRAPMGEGEGGQMSKLRVHCFAMSLDGYGAGPRQDLENPLGVGGIALHDWMIGTRTFKRMIGQDGGAAGIDDDFTARGLDNIGAWILGRNMF